MKGTARISSTRIRWTLINDLRSTSKISKKTRPDLSDKNYSVSPILVCCTQQRAHTRKYLHKILPSFTKKNILVPTFLFKNVAVLSCSYYHKIVVVTAEGHIKREHTHLKPNFGMGRMLLPTEPQGQERKQNNHSSLKRWSCALLYSYFHSWSIHSLKFRFMQMYTNRDWKLGKGFENNPTARPNARNQAPSRGRLSLVPKVHVPSRFSQTELGPFLSPLPSHHSFQGETLLSSSYWQRFDLAWSALELIVMTWHPHLRSLRISECLRTQLFMDVQPRFR